MFCDIKRSWSDWFVSYWTQRIHFDRNKSTHWLAQESKGWKDLRCSLQCRCKQEHGWIHDTERWDHRNQDKDPYTSASHRLVEGHTQHWSHILGDTEVECLRSLVDKSKLDCHWWSDIVNWVRKVMGNRSLRVLLEAVMLLVLEIEKLRIRKFKNWREAIFIC